MTALSIVNMRQSPRHPDNIDTGDQSYQDELKQILNAIKPFFDRPIWIKWLTSVPEGELLEAAKREWQIIYDEFSVIDDYADLKQTEEYARY